MTLPEEPRPPRDVPAPDPAADPSPDDSSPSGGTEHAPPHPPFARDPEDYTDPPGHHRRGPDGPALDVGA